MREDRDYCIRSQELQDYLEANRGALWRWTYPLGGFMGLAEREQIFLECVNAAMDSFDATRTKGDFHSFVRLVTQRRVATELRSEVYRKKRISFRGALGLSLDRTYGDVKNTYADEDSPLNEPTSGDDPAEEVCFREMVREFTDSLPNMERLVVIARLQGHGLNGIAEQLGNGVTLKAVDNAMQRVKRKLIVYLNEVGGGEFYAKAGR